jgi:hypothetical protein
MDMFPSMESVRMNQSIDLGRSVDSLPPMEFNPNVINKKRG